MNEPVMSPSLTFEYESDDASGKILNARQNADLTPYQKLMEKKEREQRQGSIGQKVGGAVDAVSSVASDIGAGLVEAPRQALAGFLDATGEAAEILESTFGQLPTAGEDYKPVAIEAKPRTVTGQGVRSVSQFLTGFIPALKSAKYIGVGGKVAQSAMAGAVADAVVFDAHEERLSDVIQKVPNLQNPITEYLASDLDDSEAEGRLKNAIEGLFIGGAVDTLFTGVKLIKTQRAAKAEADAQGKPLDEMIAEQTPLSKLDSQEFIPFQDAAAQKSAELQVPEFKTGKNGAEKEAAKNINLSRLDTPEDIKNLIDAVGEADASSLNAARREKISNVDL